MRVINMIRFKLKELMAEKAFVESRRITIEEVSKQTGVHRTTLSKISNIKGYSASTDILNKLCTYFEVPIEELVVFIPGDYVKN